MSSEVSRKQVVYIAQHVPKYLLINVLTLVDFDAVHIHARRVDRRTFAALCAIALHLYQHRVFFVIR